MVKIKFNKGGWILLLSLLFMATATLPTSATIFATKPKVGNQENQSVVEQGATFRITVKYTNDMGREVKIVAVKLFLEYDPNVVDAPPQYINEQGTILGVEAAGMFDTDGQIKFDATPSNQRAFLEVGTGETKSLLTLVFHVKKTSGAGTPPGIKWWAQIPSEKTINDYVYVKEQGDINVTPANKITAIDAISIASGVAPNFSGLDSGPNGLFDGDKANNKPSVGNTITLDWRTFGAQANDLNNGAQTFYSDGKLRYHVYRDNVKIAEFTLGNVGEYLFRDGDASGIPTTGLKDGTRYTYKVTAVDNTDSGINPNDLDFIATSPNERDTQTQTITPTDTTPPREVSGLTITPGDGKLTLNWTNPGDADLGGVVIVRGERELEQGTFTGADSQTYAHGGIISEGAKKFGGEVIFAGNTLDNRGSTEKQRDKQGTVLNKYEDSGLTNGKMYYYKIFTYDQAVGTPGVDLVQMGRNYSSGVSAEAAPGVAPDAITNFYAISRMAENEITLKWDNSADLSKPQGGTVIWYTTDVANKWANIPDSPSDWADADKMKNVELLKIEPRTEASETSESIVVSQNAAGTALSTTETYFFKAFAYNETGTPLTSDDLKDANKIAAYRFSSGVLAAAAPTIGGAGAGGGGGPLTFNLLPSSTEKLVVNSITIPYGMTITKASQLINLINRKAGKDIVIVLGKWDPATGTAVGLKPDGEGVDFDLRPGEGYQLYVNESFKLTLP